MVVKRIAAAVILSLLVAAPAPADDLDFGVVAFDRKDYQTAMSLFRPRAEKGDARAQYYLGRMYYDGLGVALDNTKAVAWFTKAARQGAPEAQYRLGLFNVYQGREEEGVAWLRKAAEQGYALAQDNLALLYTLGHGVSKDYVRARMWWILAESNGLAEARRKRDGTTPFMSEDEIAEARDRARAWMASHPKAK